MKKIFNILIPLLLAWLIVVAIGMTHPVIGDAGLYAAIAKRMANQNEYFNLFLLNNDYIQKPHLQFWVSALSMKLFGFNSFAFKLPSVIFAIIGVAGLYKIGKLLHSQKLGFYASFIWLFSLAFLLHVNDIHMDTMMSGFIIWTAFFWIRYLKFNDTTSFLIGCFPLALAMMTKGPLGAFVPATGLIVGILASKQWTFLFKPIHFVGILLTLLFISPVLYGIYNQHGADGLLFYFLENNTSRIQSESSFWDKDFSFHLHTILWFFLPWSLASFASFNFVIKDLRKNKIENIWAFALGSFCVFFIIASISKQQAPHYIFTLLPFFALIGAYGMLTNKKLFKILLIIPIACLAFALLFVFIRFTPAFSFWLIVALGLLAVSLFFALRYQANITKLILINGILITTFFAYLNIEVFQNKFANLDATKSIAQQVNQLPNVNNISAYLYDHPAARLDFYTNAKVNYTPSNQAIPQLTRGDLLVVEQKNVKKFVSRYQLKIVDQFKNLRLNYPVEWATYLLKNDESKLQTYYLIEIE